MEPARQIRRFPKGAVKIPPSKSIAHRALICAGLANGESIINNVSCSQDMEATIRCMSGLGAGYVRDSSRLIVNGGLKTSNGLLLDCGESGTTLRLLMPVAALTIDKEISFTGCGRLMQRPLTPYLKALNSGGISFFHSDKVLTLSGKLTSGKYVLPGDVSSQYVSGLLLALPLLDGVSEIELSTPLQSTGYVDLTIETMKYYGVYVENDNYSRIIVSGNQVYKPKSVDIEADFSQAAFFLVAGALGCPCECIGLRSDSFQGDSAIIDILLRSGIIIDKGLSGGIIARPGEIMPQTVDVSEIPDLAPPLAALFAFGNGESRLVNAGRLRHKESDRLQAICSALNSIGTRIVVSGDTLIIDGRSSIRGGRMPAFNDHRIAMMGAVAAIRAENPVYIEQSECVAKSYPDFWTDFEVEPMEG